MAKNLRGAHRALCLNRRAMPKVKTHSGAKKRFKISPKGKVKARHAMRSHILGKKNAKRRRRLDAPKQLADADRKTAKTLLRK